MAARVQLFDFQFFNYIRPIRRRTELITPGMTRYQRAENTHSQNWCFEKLFLKSCGFIRSLLKKMRNLMTSPSGDNDGKLKL